MFDAVTPLDVRKARAIESLHEYLEFAPGTYGTEEIEKCDAILTGYLAEITSPRVAGNEIKIAATLKRTVLALNGLNDECGGDLLGTDQRDEIVPLLLDAATLAGLTAENDLTEPYREF